MKRPANNLEHLTKCPLCQKEYGNFNITILDQKRGKATLHLTCEYCQTASLVFVIVNQSGILSLGMVTDVTKEEAKRMLNREAVSADDVVEIYGLLKKTEKAEELI